MATPVINSPEQLDSFMSRLGVRLQSYANRKARLEARVAKARHSLDDAVNRLNELNRREAAGIKRDGAIIFVYVAPRLDELMKGGSEATVGAGKLTHRHRNVGALEFTTDEAAAVAEIKSRFPKQAEAIIQVKETVRKDILKKEYPDVLAAMTSASAGAVDTLGIQPANTSEKLIQPYSVYERDAASLGII